MQTARRGGGAPLAVDGRGDGVDGVGRRRRAEGQARQRRHLAVELAPHGVGGGALRRRQRERKHKGKSEISQVDFKIWESWPKFPQNKLFPFSSRYSRDSGGVPTAWWPPPRPPPPPPRRGPLWPRALRRAARPRHPRRGRKQATLRRRRYVR